MSKLQEVFNRIQVSKKEQKGIKASYRDALKSSQQYQLVLEELKALKEKKKKIEEGIKDEFSSEFNKLEILKADIDNDMALLSDAALSQFLKGETVEVVDDKDNKYEPIFRVSFKRS